MKFFTPVKLLPSTDISEGRIVATALVDFETLNAYGHLTGYVFTVGRIL